MKKRMLATLLAGSMSLTTCDDTGRQTVPRAPKGEASQSVPADTRTQLSQEVTMKVSMGVTDSHFEATAVNRMKEYIEEQTGGNFTIEIFIEAQIGNDQGVFKGLELGVADVLPHGTDIVGDFSKDFGLSLLPYLSDSEKQVGAVVESESGQSLLKELEDIGYMGLGFENFGLRHITNNKHPINSVEDMEGLEIKTMTTPIHLEAFEVLGANPTPMAFSELFSTLQQGVVNDQENPLVSTYANKPREAQKYPTPDGHVSTFAIFVASKDWHDKLGPSYQQILNDDIKIATEYMRENRESKGVLASEKMKEAGVEVVELTPEAEDGLRGAARGVSEKYGNKISSDRYKGMLDITAAVQQMTYRKGLHINGKRKKL